MFQNYLKIALRSLSRQKMYSVINVVGLALGLATCLLLALYVSDELSFERFHANYDRIYRVTGGMDNNDVKMFRGTLMPPKLAPYLKENHADVELTTRCMNAALDFRRGKVVILPNEQNQGFQADPSFFSIFSFPVLFGNPNALGQSPTNIVLTRSLAAALFGEQNLASAVGQTVEAMKTPFTVVAILDDVPKTSHLRFSFVVGLQEQPYFADWMYSTVSTYILLKQGRDWRSVNDAASMVAKKIITPAFVKFNAAWSWKQELQPLSAIRLYSALEGEQGTIGRVRVFATVGVLVLLLACINYINLATARSMLRSREVGVRKTFGASRGQVMMQFLGEAAGLVFVAFLIALVVAEVSLPFFNVISGKSFTAKDFLQLRFITPLIGIVIFTVVVSGGYSAFVLSAFRPIDTLKIGFVPRGKGVRLRKGLVVLQFLISTVLLCGIWVINEQMRFMTNANLGFNSKQILAAHLDRSLLPKHDAIIQEMKKIPGVEDIGSSMQTPVVWTGAALIPVESVIESHSSDNARRKDELQTVQSEFHTTSFDFQRVMQVPLLQGRFFERGRDSVNTVVVNASFAKAMNWGDAVGKTVSYTWDGKKMQAAVIGVVGDIHSKSLKSKVLPIVYHVSASCPVLLLRVAPQNMSAVLHAVEERYNSFKPQFPLELKFLDEEFAKLYAEEDNLRKTLLAMTVIAVIIALLGLFGLAVFSAERRTKEIGIRKVLGASVSSIIGLLSQDFLKLVGIAIVLATPLAYWAASKWLQDFAYRIELSWWMFAAAGVLAVVIAFITVAGQAWRAARANPVQSLRSE